MDARHTEELAEELNALGDAVEAERRVREERTERIASKMNDEVPCAALFFSFECFFYYQVSIVINTLTFAKLPNTHMCVSLDPRPISPQPVTLQTPSGLDLDSISPQPVTLQTPSELDLDSIYDTTRDVPNTL
jgi:hypothetical protein